jgi:uncharacterized protein YdiU (UPF0061 family)
MMNRTQADWTLFWRQLAVLRGRVGDGGELDAAVVAEVMAPAFYLSDGNPRERVLKDLLSWLRSHWIPSIKPDGCDAAAASAAMKQASPKYVPREWMLVTAYTAAATGDYSTLHALHELFKTP